MLLRVKVKPNSRQNQLVKLPDGSWQVKIHAPAQDGKANDELVKFLSDVFDLPKSKIRIISGHTAPFKKIELLAGEEYLKSKLKET